MLLMCGDVGEAGKARWNVELEGKATTMGETKWGANVQKKTGTLKWVKSWRMRLATYLPT